MRLRSLTIALVGTVCGLITAQGHASSRSIRVDNPGFACDLGPVSNVNSWATTSPDPFATVDGNSDGSQNPSTFFSPGTIVAPPAIFCEPPVSLSSIWNPNSSDYDSADTPNPASDPDPTTGVPTIPELTATAGVMYEWINPNLSGNNSFANNPDAEVMVWTLPASTSVSSTLVNGGFDIEFDNWCGTNDYGESSNGAPLGVPAPASAVPSFTWNGNKYAYTLACGAGGASFNGNDLLFDASGVLIGYVNASNAAIFTPTVPGWQMIAIPAGLSAASGSGSITLTWTPTIGAGSYSVYQSSATGDEGTTPVKTGITLGTAVINGLTSGQVYFFKVTAVYTGVESGQSSEISATVLAATPTGLRATAGAASIGLQWNTSAGASSYNIFEGSSTGKESSTPIITGLTTTSYTVPGLTQGQTYFFNVVAVDAGGKSPSSNQATATLIAAAPTGLTPTTSSGAVALSWTASTGATSYNVYQGTSAGGESSVAVKSSIMGTSATIAALTNGQTYYFKVAAVDAGGVSAQSNEVSAMPSAPASSGGGGGSIDLIDVLVGGAMVLFGLRRRSRGMLGLRSNPA
jgi:fibronectin type 3 domain-containing protein